MLKTLLIAVFLWFSGKTNNIIFVRLCNNEMYNTILRVYEREINFYIKSKI